MVRKSYITSGGRELSSMGCWLIKGNSPANIHVLYISGAHNEEMQITHILMKLYNLLPFCT